MTVVNSPREITDVRLAIGSNAASAWWVNGKEVVALYNDRQTVIDEWGVQAPDAAQWTQYRPRRHRERRRNRFLCAVPRLWHTGRYKTSR